MKEFSPSSVRNEEPIAQVLGPLLPESDPAEVLEVGSGTGQHAVAFSRRFPHVKWQPTNLPGTLSSIEAWRKEVGLANLRPALPFDLFDEAPPVDEVVDLVIAINVIHIASFDATPRLFEHAAGLLSEGSHIFLYGPFRHQGQPLEPSNEEFDSWLRRRDPESGIRLFEDVDRIAGELGFSHVETRRLPANNDAIWWKRLP